MLSEKDRASSTQSPVMKHISLPPVRGCRPGGISTTTTNLLPQHQHHLNTGPLDPGGGSPTVAGTLLPEGRTQSLKNGNQVHPQLTGAPQEQLPHQEARITAHGKNQTTNPESQANPRRRQTLDLNAETTARSHRGPKANIKFASLNIKGRMSGDINKWLHIPQMMRENQIGILTVQETHLTKELAEQIHTLFGNMMALHYS